MEINKYIFYSIILEGHSLGAHIAGAAGRYLNYRTQKFLPRVTGLDSANPCFNEGEVLTGLARGDAEFVDIIHSNPGIYIHLILYDYHYFTAKKKLKIFFSFSDLT